MKDKRTHLITRRGFKQIEIDSDNYEQLYNIWNQQAEGEAFELDILREFNVCPLPLITVRSYLLLELYFLLDGLGQVDLFTLGKYPAIYIDAVKIIRRELSRARIHYDVRGG